MEINVFSDNDGVNAGFLAGFKAKFGKEFDSVPAGQAWAWIGRDSSFFSDLPLMPDVRLYWDAIKKHNPTILTGCPSASFAKSEIGKRSWLEKHREIFGEHTKMIVCLTKDKPKHMIKPGDILIDDHQKNIDAWQAAGGIGILFKNAKQAIADFNTVMDNLTEDLEKTDDIIE